MRILTQIELDPKALKRLKKTKENIKKVITSVNVMIRYERRYRKNEFIIKQSIPPKIIKLDNKTKN